MVKKTIFSLLILVIVLVFYPASLACNLQPERMNYILYNIASGGHAWQEEDNCMFRDYYRNSSSQGSIWMVFFCSSTNVKFPVPLNLVYITKSYTPDNSHTLNHRKLK